MMIGYLMVRMGSSLGGMMGGADGRGLGAIIATGLAMTMDPVGATIGAAHEAARHGARQGNGTCKVIDRAMSVGALVVGTMGTPHLPDTTPSVET
jgi:hypothetical protein